MTLTQELSAISQASNFSIPTISNVYNTPWIHKSVFWEMENWNGDGTTVPYPFGVFGAGWSEFWVVVKKLEQVWSTRRWAPYILNSAFSGTSNSYQANGQPQYGEIEIFQNRLVFPFGQDKIKSVYGFTTGKKELVTCANGSATITLKEGTWDQKISTGTIVLSKDASTYSVEYTVTYATPTTATLSGTFSGTSGDYKVTIERYCDGWVQNDGTVTPLVLPNKSKMYRPMISFGRQLYVGDGSLVSKLSDDGLWQTSIYDVGKDYTIKKFVQVNGSIYILADKVNGDFSDVNTDTYVGTSTSILIQWDGTSKNSNNVVEIGTHCYGIEAFENRLYAVLKQRWRQWPSGLTLSYFAGSDFPTIARLDASYAYPNCFSMERGTIYVWVSGGNSPWVYVYSSFSTEAGAVSLEYPIAESIYSLAYIPFGGWFYLTGTTLFVNSDTNSYMPWLYRENGVLESNWIEVSPNQFWQLVKGVQFSFYQDLPTGAYVGIEYAMDGSASYTSLWNIDLNNMYDILLWIYTRPRKIKLRFTVHASTNRALSPEITKIQLY